MKKFYLLLLLCTISACGQDSEGFTLEPTPGDRFMYFLNGGAWETQIKTESRFALHLFQNPDIGVHVRIQRFDDTPVDEFLALTEYVDNQPYLSVICNTFSAPMGSDDYTIESCTIYGSDIVPFDSDPILELMPSYYYIPDRKDGGVRLDVPPNMNYLREVIREFYKSK